MAVNYSVPVINARLQAVANAINDAGDGLLKLVSNSTVVSTFILANPCGIVNNGVLTFTGPLLDPFAANTGFVTTGIITDGIGVVMISGLSVGIATGADIIISNGLNSTLIQAGQSVSLLSAQIVGS